MAQRNKWTTESEWKPLRLKAIISHEMKPEIWIQRKELGIGQT